MNDSIAENECVADFTTSHDELEKIMLVNGTEHAAELSTTTVGMRMPVIKI